MFYSLATAIALCTPLRAPMTREWPTNYGQYSSEGRVRSHVDHGGERCHPRISESIKHITLNPMDPGRGESTSRSSWCPTRHTCLASLHEDITREEPGKCLSAPIQRPGKTRSNSRTQRASFASVHFFCWPYWDASMYQFHSIIKNVKLNAWRNDDPYGGTL